LPRKSLRWSRRGRRTVLFIVIAAVAWGGFTVWGQHLGGALAGALTSPGPKASHSVKVSKPRAKKAQYPAVAIAPHTAVGPNFNWNAPSDGPYPSIPQGADLWIDASLSAQRVYIMNGQNVIYTMITSSGIPGSSATDTPTGTYHIQNRGTWFYSSRFQEGAEYWVSWSGWGDYLFHSVPMNSQEQVIPSVAAKLGVPASHGCFHLTIPDAKWIYDNIPEGTRVVIQSGVNAVVTASIAGSPAAR